MKPAFFRSLLISKLPIAFIAGLKLKSYSDSKAEVLVKHSWINQNPFKSMFWAVQGMAAELSTGLLCISKIKDSKKSVSMLVIEQNGKFFKKAKGKITFSCEQGLEIDKTLKQVIENKTSETLILKSKGIDESGVLVSEFLFTWSFKLRN